jgi:hypothetical protein
MGYGNPAQRMAQTYLDTLPPFVPAKPGPTLGSAGAVYQFMAGLYRRLFAEPTSERTA